MTEQRRCPHHPRFWVDDCQPCDAAISRREWEEGLPDDDAADREADRYERWLDECAEGRP